MPKAPTSLSQSESGSPHSEGSQGPNQPARKVRKGFSRSRNGCLTCRTNHQKCDEGKPGCLRCQLGRRECVWAPGTIMTSEAEDVKPFVAQSQAGTSFVPQSQAGPLPTLLDNREYTTTTIYDPSYLDSLVGVSSPTMRQPLEPCELAYPDQGQRQLIQLFVREAGKLIVNINVQPQQIAFLDLPRLLSEPGNGFSADALRFSLLGIGALSEAWSNRRTADPQAVAGTLQIAGSLKDAATACLSATIALSGISPTTSVVQLRDRTGVDDTALMAAAMLSFSQVLSGLKGQHQPFELAYGLVKARGGPRRVLDAVRASGTRSEIQKVVEFIAVIDVLDALGTGRIPDFLYSTTDDLSWWHRAHETRSYLELDTVETCFGISRSVLAVFAKVVALVARSQTGRITQLNTLGEDAWDLELLMECSALDEELNTCTTGDGYLLSLPRAQQGDQVYIQTGKLLLARSVRRAPRSSLEVQRGAMSILTLLLDCHTRFGSVLYFMWPLLVAGSQIAEHFRPLVHTLLDVFSGTYLFDCAAAGSVLKTFWMRMDSGVADEQIQNVVRELGYHFL